jgi:hypothetical protein
LSLRQTEVSLLSASRVMPLRCAKKRDPFAVLVHSAAARGGLPPRHGEHEQNATLAGEMGAFWK